MIRKVKKTRTIAPHLFSGERRERTFNRLPSDIKEGLIGIAYDKNQSVSWVLEQIIIDYFGFRTPKYIKRKNNE